MNWYNLKTLSVCCVRMSLRIIKSAFRSKRFILCYIGITLVCLWTSSTFVDVAVAICVCIMNYSCISTQYVTKLSIENNEVWLLDILFTDILPRLFSLYTHNSSFPTNAIRVQLGSTKTALVLLQNGILMIYKLCFYDTIVSL